MLEKSNCIASDALDDDMDLRIRRGCFSAAYRTGGAISLATTRDAAGADGTGRSSLAFY